MALTPLMITAMNGFLNNDSIDFNSEFLNLLDEYVNLPIIKKYREVFGGHYYYPETTMTWPKGTEYSITQEIQKAYINDLYDKSYLIDYYIDSHCNIGTNYLSESILEWGYILLGKDRYNSHKNHHAKFLQTFQIVSGYIDQLNEAINSAINGGSVASASFTSMDELSTGNLSILSSKLNLYAEDLKATGNLLDFNELDFYGTPHGLLLALIRTNAITMIIDDLSTILSNNDIDNISIDEPLSLRTQKEFYTFCKTISGTKLQNILLIMNIDTDDITTLADLIDTKKIMPLSWNYLQTLVSNKIISLTQFNGDTGTLSNIIPKEIAKYNIGFKNALLQIKGIYNIKVKDLIEQCASIELNTGLSNINDFTSALPGSIVSQEIDNSIPSLASSNLPTSGNNLISIDTGSAGILNIIANGQDKAGRYYLSDGIGTPAGIQHDTLIAEIIEYHNQLDTQLVNDIINTEHDINDNAWIFDSEYKTNNPEPNPIDYPQGINDPDYITDWNNWNNNRIQYILNSVQPNLDNLKSLINSTPDTDITFDKSINQINTEKITLLEAIDWPENDAPDRPNNIFNGGLCAYLWNNISTGGHKKTVLGFSSLLHDFGNRIDLHDAAEILEKIATNSTGGEAIIAAMREGRNLKKLDNSGVLTDTRIDPTPK